MAEVCLTCHLNLSSTVKAAFALAGGFPVENIRSALNPEELDNAVQGDIVRLVPDATFGFNTYGKNWYAGLSIPQL